jgi:hypothetical protein
VTANRRTAQAQLLDAMLELLGRQIRMLQGDRRERDEPIRVRRHPFRQPVVLDLHDPPREVAIGGVPPIPVDRQRLYVDALLIRICRRAVRAPGSPPPPALRQRRVLDDLATSTTQWQCTSITLIRFPRWTPRGAAARAPDRAPPPDPSHRCPPVDGLQECLRSMGTPGEVQSSKYKYFKVQK